MPYEKELKVAIEAVRKAARLCRQVQQHLVSADTVEKKDRSPVTIADLGSQAIICRELQEHFPHDPVVGEEEADILRRNPDLAEKVTALVSEQLGVLTREEVFRAIDHGGGSADFRKRYWTLDPIDGTKGFLRGEQYAIALALVEEGQVVLGVLGLPNFFLEPGQADSSQGVLFRAVRGEGAFQQLLEGEEVFPISVDANSDPSRARFTESVESGHASHEEHLAISRVLGITQPPFRMDSQGKYAAVARGDASIYLRLPRSLSYREKIWDHAAGVVVVEEAGGKVTDFRGKTLDFSLGRKLENNIGILVTNGHLHQQALAAIRRVVKGLEEKP